MPRAYAIFELSSNRGSAIISAVMNKQLKAYKEQLKRTADARALAKWLADKHAQAIEEYLSTKSPTNPHPGD